MHPFARAALIALLSLAPLSALAQVSTTQSLTPSTTGAILFYDWPQDFISNSNFFGAFANDVAPYASQISSYATPLPNTLWTWSGSGGNLEHYDFLYDGGADNGATANANPRTDLSHSTLNRVCSLIDPTAVSPTSGTYAPSYNGSWQGSASNADANRVFVYSPTTITWSGGNTPAGWSDKSQQHTGCPNGDYYCHYGVERFACTTYALPGQGLSASSYNISAGQSVTLSWTTAYRDTALGYISSHDYVSPTRCLVTPPPPTSCSSTGFTLSGYTLTVFDGGEYDQELHRCLDQYSHDAFIVNSTGSVTVSPTTTTTYSFTCTNPNGTRTVSATVNVGNAAPTVTATVNGVSSASIATGQSFDLKMTSANAASCTWKRTGSYSGNWTNQPVPAPGTSYDSGALTWGAGNATWTFTCKNAGGTSVSQSASVKITNGPDLTAGAVLPSTATVGSATTLSATITNGGAATTGSGFPDLFEISQVNNPSLFSQIYATKSYASAALAAGDSNTASASYTFPSAGTWYVRACANTDTSGNTPASSYTGTPESNYANNCSSSWTAVAVANPACTNGANNPPSCTQCPNNLAYIGGSCIACSNGGCTGPGGSASSPTGGLACNNGATNPASCNAFPPSCSTLSATPTDINTGDTVSLTWSCSGASSCAQIANSDGFSTGNKVSGTDNSVKPSISSGQVTYGLACGGTNFYFPPVTVHSPKATLSASATRVPSGSTVTLHGVGTDVKSCAITNDTQGSTVIADSKAANGSWDKTSAAQTISSQTVYTLSCKTNGASVTSSLIVNVLPGFKEF